jgi:hypothetical protein
LLISRHGVRSNGNTIAIKYPILQVNQATWEIGTKEYLSFNVKPEKTGNFTLYVKVSGNINLESFLMPVNEPQSGTLDQLNEYVLVYSFPVY